MESREIGGLLVFCSNSMTYVCDHGVCVFSLVLYLSQVLQQLWEICCRLTGLRKIVCVRLIPNHAVCVTECKIIACVRDLRCCICIGRNKPFMQKLDLS
jgi:hypothetical protein